MRRYESYKDSGVEWLGEVPSHWNLIPNKYIFKLRKNVVEKRSSEYDLLSLSLKGVIKRDMANPEGKFPAEFDTYQEVKEGDFIFCLFDVEETPRTVGLSSYHGMITGAYTIFETNNVDKKFIYYFYLNLDSDKRLKPLYKGLRNTISKETFFSFNTFIPPLSEQQKIAQFLNDKTAKIDQAVDLAEKQIALLKEHKQILIQNAVTRGLNPDVPLKDSGVEWIGQVPEHWELTIGMNVFRENKRDNKGMKENTVLSLSYGKIIIKPEEKLFGLVPESFETYQIVEPNDIIIRCTDLQNDQTSLRTGLAQDKGIITSAYLNLKVINNYSAKFLHYYLHALDITKVLYKFGSGLRQNLSFLDFKRLPIIDISLAEQQKIADYLDTQTAKIDQAIALKTAHIEKLKEYKSVLINDVVTGKVRV
ncbi:TPA: restriction endonuclease subunit S [Haemophilus influenzae]|uniref:restriction endonuclease subunit S n=1 Tax=Haemophilus influenzae TaxID=727 RepID=UPI0007668985|nr:restriction endonuclease subunit S [Haemophilus influenzae]MCK8952418.1 restriction endonuclease subunit S [Haemophilus influenzae]MCK9096493.1 restriction endonuclease subunit S [Haemophilus influenzae]OBX54727.1 restriction endonuclease subunit S [Haemophilus influenzae]ORJ39578.1 restriction endonuclease subunit S [Haemophilus influenzae]POR97100.1 restriction endonuclease subunit S [Haemophilus influenzae]